jgi:antitoxin component YwqK of YwqJK toxin-antitoxin module
MMILATIAVAQREVVLYHGYTGIVAERKLVNANGIKCGYDKIYNTDGVLVEMYTYKNGKKNGPCASYSPYTGQILSSGNFTADERSGVWTIYSTSKGVPKDTPEERLTYPSRNPNLTEKTFEEEEDYYHAARVLVKDEKWRFIQGKNVLIYMKTRDSEKKWSSQGKLLTEKLQSNGEIVYELEYWDNGKIKVKNVPNDTCFEYDMKGNKIEAYFLENYGYSSQIKKSLIIFPAQTETTLPGQTTSAHFNCGSPITINHKAGTVAPVTKTVTYGTVTNIPGELTKCWITSNLGADFQA